MKIRDAGESLGKYTRIISEAVIKSRYVKPCPLVTSKSGFVEILIDTDVSLRWIAHILTQAQVIRNCISFPWTAYSAATCVT